MADYPAELECRRTLADGREVLIRPVRADDEARERAFFAGLSPESLQSRFLKFVHAVSEKTVQSFTHIDYDRHMALVAEAGREIVGQARYLVNPDGASCEFAVVVADAWRRSGIAGLLMSALLDAARRRGLRRMEGLVLRDNRPMLKFVRALGFKAEPEPLEPTLVRVEKTL